MVHTFEFIETKGIKRIWTGKTDTHGVKIYDGDVITGRWDKHPDVVHEVIKWDDERSGFWPFYYMEGNLQNDYDDDYFISENCDIIGNIIESPHLENLSSRHTVFHSLD